jgi:hypothetical protein
MRRRLRERLHRQFLTTVCAYVVTFDDGLRQRLLDSEPGTPFRIEGACSPGIQRLVEGARLRFWVTVVRRLAASTAVVVFWAEEFPSIRDEGVIFSTADLDLTPELSDQRDG